MVTARDAALLTDFRYVEQARVQSPSWQVRQVSSGLSWFPELVFELRVKRIGFDSHHLDVATHQTLIHSLKEPPAGARPSLVSTEGLVEALRVVKDPDELALMQQAAKIADQAFDAVAPTIRAGETEKAIAWRLERTMREMGAEVVSFDIIVAAGPNGAMPHHHPSERPVATGEPIVIDMGARYEGYCSDLTRTVFVGEPDQEFVKVYDIVLGAQLTAIALIRPGMTGEEADALAREVIRQAGYENAFGHGLGHGVGLAVHEQPRLGPGSDRVLEEGMVFSVEPGIYLPGQGGVRIEDMVVLEREGIRTLSRANKTV